MNQTFLRLSPYRERCLAWWAQRSVRERSLLLAMVVLLAMTALVSLVIRPLQASRAAAIADIKVYDTLIVRLRASGPITASPITSRTGDVSAIVQTSAPQFGLVVRNISGHGQAARVQMTAVPYEGVMRWLADLDQSSDLRVRRVSLQPSGTAGAVNVDLVLTS